MTSVLERILTTVTSTLVALWQWLSNTTRLVSPAALNPANWNLTVWLGVTTALLLCTILWLLRPRTGRKSKLPELLVSKGDIRQAGSGAAQLLVLKVSNLNDYPVQLIEMTLQTELMSSALIIEAAELLSPGETAELEATLHNNMSGDTGTLLVYVMQTRRQKLYQLKAIFDWEPWAMRYKISPLGQKVKAVRRLESERLNKLRKRAWHEQYFYEPDSQTKPTTPQPAPQREPQRVSPAHVPLAAPPATAPRQLKDVTAEPAKSATAEATEVKAVEVPQSGAPEPASASAATVDSSIDPLLLHDEDYVPPPPRRATRPTPVGLLKDHPVDTATQQKSLAHAKAPSSAASERLKPVTSSTPFRSRSALKEIAELDFPKEF